ncbi:MAG: ketol-acid reductoisomerase [Euryarchaeota archaeon]|nr:ketol-acid reductoisomerase [Euryarchaeota archaeon]
MSRIYYEEDVELSVLEGETVAVIGYGSQGSAQAQNFRDSGVEVVLGLRENGESWKRASRDGFEVLPIDEAARKGSIVHMLIPDEVQPGIYERYVRQNLEEGNALSFSHGFNIRFGQIVPPENVDVIMMAPKGPGAMVREEYLRGSGVPALVAVEQDFTGRAKQRALALAKANGSARVGVLETTFAEETETDLFGEQVDLCGGSAELIKAAFETLVEAGYSPEVAYFECLHELKLIVDLYYREGIEGMWRRVSNTAEYGGRTRGRRIINQQVREEMRRILEEIRSGEFAREWVLENRAGMPVLKSLREEDSRHQIEEVGKRLRKMMKLK